MKMDKDSTIIDVRMPQEFASQHVPGAINVPLDQLPQQIDEIKSLRRPIVAYCRSGNRSGIAVTILTQHGINEVINGGGIDNMLTTTN